MTAAHEHSNAEVRKEDDPHLEQRPMAHSGSPKRTSPTWLNVHSFAMGCLFALPGLFVVVRAVQLSSDPVATISDSLGPLGRTILLASSVTASASALGTVLAWLVTKSDLRGRAAWRVLLVLPLVLPSFVGAAAFLTSLAPGGLLHELLGVFDVESPRLRGFWPAWTLLTLFTYPYVMLPVSARLLTLRPALEESARLLGSSGSRAFLKITLPQLQSSLFASGLLVFLYVVSEFGAVQLLGYDTLTRVIFATRLADRATSFTSSTLLIALAVLVVGLERRARRFDRPDDRVRLRTREVTTLGRRQPISLLLVATVTFLGLIAPVASLAVWAVRGIADQRIDLSELVRPAANTVATGVATSVLAVALVIPIAVLLVRYRSATARVASIAVVGGFAVPGVVIALSLVFWTLNTPGLNRLYQTWPLLVLAYIVHFGSQALGAAEGAVRSVPAALRESSQLLESSKSRRLLRVDFPLMRPGLASGGGLVLLSTLKELPATLLLAPIGFETLATEIWGSFEDGFYAEVGVASLVLVASSAFLTWLLVLRPTDRPQSSA
ncbi:MAG: iron(III) transport system permease protein [Acidimicrobiales bacterium]